MGTVVMSGFHSPGLVIVREKEQTPSTQSLDPWALSHHSYRFFLPGYSEPGLCTVVSCRVLRKGRGAIIILRPPRDSPPGGRYRPGSILYACVRAHTCTLCHTTEHSPTKPGGFWSARSCWSQVTSLLVPQVSGSPGSSCPSAGSIPGLVSRLIAQRSGPCPTTKLRWDLGPATWPP